MHTVSFSDLVNSDLYIDAIYEGGNAGNAGDDPISKLLLGTGNQGGFRLVGPKGGQAIEKAVIHRNKVHRVRSPTRPFRPDGANPAQVRLGEEIGNFLVGHSDLITSRHVMIVVAGPVSARNRDRGQGRQAPWFSYELVVTPNRPAVRGRQLLRCRGRATVSRRGSSQPQCACMRSRERRSQRRVGRPGSSTRTCSGGGRTVR